ncbi:hypothetical protein B6U66_01735 [Candidatus Bathyarchaeota archaeon ex4484_135]|nr:MAG: hypothetical protein B6U66_01735 [Candidatus Bathyarchaeota archaeon ex4484_135]
MAGTVVIGVRVSPQMKKILERLAEARGEQLSDLVRRAIKRELARAGLLDPEEAKLLEIRL